MGNPVKKVQGAVERIDDPAMRSVAALSQPTLLAQKAVAWTRLFKRFTQDFLGPPIGRGCEICRPLRDTCRCSTSPKSPAEGAARLVGGFDHHIEKGGAEHDCRMTDVGCQISDVQLTQQVI